MVLPGDSLIDSATVPTGAHAGASRKLALCS
jgi:hypothetical protein